MKIKQFLIWGLISLIYIILIGPMAYYGSELWRDILFGKVLATSILALYWSYAFFYISMAIIFLAPAVGILAVALNIRDNEVNII